MAFLLAGAGRTRTLTVLLGLAAIVIVVAGLRGAASLIGPMFLALVLTITAHPLRQWLRRLRMPNWLSSLICMVVVYAAVAGLGLALLASTARFAALLPQYGDQFDGLLSRVAHGLQTLGVDADDVHRAVAALDLGKLAGLLNALLGGVFGVASNLVFILTLVFFMTVDAAVFPRLLSATGPQHAPLVSALQSFAVGTRSYLLVSTVFGFIVALLDTASLALLGIPVPLIWGLLAFLTNYIPNIGFVIGLVPPAVLALLQGGPGLCLAVVVVYAVINVVIQTVIQPRFVGDAVGLSTTLTFLSLIVWSWVIGPLGALLAIPLTLLVRSILVEANPQLTWLLPVLSNRAEREPDEVPPKDPPE